MIPTVQFSPEEAAAGGWLPASLNNAVNSLRARGCLWLQNVIEPSYIDALRGAFIADYSDFFRMEGAAASALVVGDKRLMVPVEVKGLFNQADLYAHPLMSAVMGEVLGNDFRLGGFGVVVSLPGARDQHIHCDHPALFGTPIDDFLPSFAVTMIVPLVDFNAMTGCTRVWEESHLARYHVANAGVPMEKRAYHDPYARMGDCLLMDYRLYHAGLENRSDTVRPILYVTYFRPWFRDYVNYRKHSPLIIRKEEHEKIPVQHRSLFANATVI